MENVITNITQPRHARITEPSIWVRRFAPLIPEGAWVLDLAAGAGRHTRHLLSLGYKVVAVDRDTNNMTDLSGRPDIEIIEADLENTSPWPLPGRIFAGIVITNYLYRPLFDAIMASLAPGGVLIYETFARGNETFTRPRNPDHLLTCGELLQHAAAANLQVVAYEHGIVESGPIPGVIQRIVAINDLRPDAGDDATPPLHPIEPTPPSAKDKSR